MDRGDPMDDVTVLTALVDVTWLSNDIHDSYTGAGGVPRPCLEAVTVRLVRNVCATTIYMCPVTPIRSDLVENMSCDLMMVF